MSVMLDKLLKGQSFEWKKLGDITKVLRGKRLTKSQLADEEKYPVFHGGLEPLGFYNHFNRNANTVMVINVGASAGTVGYSDVDFWSSDGCFCIEKAELLNDKFLYYFLIGYQNYLKSKVRVAGIPTLDALIVEKIEIPIPPLDVQAKIVKILDAFTALTAELTAELNMRKKQYHYYRDKLLNFSDDVPLKKLEDVVDIYLGLTYTPNYVEKGIKFISAQNTSNDYLDLTKVKYISEEEFKNSTSNAKPIRGDILFTRVGSNLGHPVIIDTDEDLCIFVSLGYLRVRNKEVSNNYIRHWMKTDLFWKQVEKNVYGSAKVNLNTGWLKKFDIPIPSIEEQKRIATILDKFEAYTNSITEGLPKEIALRQKQYEYYREQLLDFPK